MNSYDVITAGSITRIGPSLVGIVRDSTMTAQRRGTGLHWAAKYIGLPYAPNGRSKAGVDCWGLLVLVYAAEWGIVLPDIPGISQVPTHLQGIILEKEAVRDWWEIALPFDGCAVAMTKQSTIHHVGIWAEIDGGKVIHCVPHQNVVADTLRNLRLRGYRQAQFYKHKSWIYKSWI